jgi:hypothetical protein
MSGNLKQLVIFGLWNIILLQDSYKQQYKPYGIYYALTYSMEQSPAWEANRFSASQGIPPAFYGTWRFITTFARV